MQKDFNGWNDEKKRVHARTRTPFCHERELWWCSLGVKVGFEQDGSGTAFRRPVLVLKHLSRETFLAVPLTKSSRKHPLRIPLGEIDGEEAQAILSQMRVIDTHRLVRKIGILDLERFEDMRKAVKAML